MDAEDFSDWTSIPEIMRAGDRWLRELVTLERLSIDINSGLGWAGLNLQAEKGTAHHKGHAPDVQYGSGNESPSIASQCLSRSCVGDASAWHSNKRENAVLSLC